MTSLPEVLSASYHPRLVEELLSAYEEAKRNFHLGGHRLSAVEGGRFCEAAYRLLEDITTGRHTPLDGNLSTAGVASALGRLPGAAWDKSIRLHIPRALRVVYDVRNSRDVAHLAGHIDPNLQDATLVVAVLDWVLAEFVRLSGAATADEAQVMVDGLVTRQVPVVQVFDGAPMVLRADLRAGDHVLVLLYHVGDGGVTVSELREWVPAPMRANMARTLRALADKAFAHLAADRVVITRAGQRHAEVKGLVGSRAA